MPGSSEGQKKAPICTGHLGSAHDRNQPGGGLRKSDEIDTHGAGEVHWRW
jgi:hypothetical protein